MFWDSSSELSSETPQALVYDIGGSVPESEAWSVLSSLKAERTQKADDCPSLISLKVSVDVKHHVYLLTLTTRICGRTVGLMDSLADEALGLSALISFAHHTYGPCSEVGVESLRSRCAEH